MLLPGSFIGGPRDMHKRYLDAMTLVQKFGIPEIFLTMTCYSKRYEIIEKLKPNELPIIDQLKKEVINKQLFFFAK